MKKDSEMERTRGSLSFNKWLLLVIPVSIAFVVGASVPTLFDLELSLVGGLIWGTVIGIIDYTLIRIKITPKLAILRFIIVLFSMSITALVGDLYFFNKDISDHVEEQNKEKFADKLSIYYTQHAKLTKDIKEEVEGLITGTPGCGPECKKLKVMRDNLKMPTLKGSDVGPLGKIRALHELISKNSLAKGSFWTFSILILVLEVLPLLLKNAKLK